MFMEDLNNGGKRDNKAAAFHGYPSFSDIHAASPNLRDVYKCQGRSWIKVERSRGRHLVLSEARRGSIIEVAHHLLRLLTIFITP